MGNTLMVYDYGADTDVSVRTFPGHTNMKTGGEMNLSLDGDRIAFYEDGVGITVYELSTDSIVATMSLVGRPAINDLTMTPKGDGVIVGWSGAPGPGPDQGMEHFEIQGNQLVFVRHLFSNRMHHDVGQWQGEDYLVHGSDDYGPVAVYAIALSDGSVTPLMIVGGLGHGYEQYHICTNSMHNDGFVYLGMYRTFEMAAPWPLPWINEIVRVPVVGGDVERIAHTRARNASAYYFMPKSTVSRSGRYILSNSDFNSGYPDVYLINQTGAISPTTLIDEALLDALKAWLAQEAPPVGGTDQADKDRITEIEKDVGNIQSGISTAGVDQ